MIQSVPMAGLSGDPASVDGPSPLSTLYKDALLTFLKIPTNLPSLGPASLRTAYAKFTVLTNAKTPMKGLRTSKDWVEHLDDQGVEPGWVPIYVDFTNIFIAKSQFYSGWKDPFLHAAAYLEMKAWLLDDPNCLSDEDLWLENKKTDEYNFVDLVNWLNKKDVVKGKKPAVASASVVKKSGLGKKDKKKKEVSSDSEDLAEKKKKKSKKRSE